MDDHASRAKALLGAGGGLEAVLTLLRELGYSKGRTMYFLAEELGMHGDEVPDLVHHSRTWSDRFEVDARASSQVLGLLDSLRKEPGDAAVDLTDWLNSQAEEAGLRNGGERGQKAAPPAGGQDGAV